MERLQSNQCGWRSVALFLHPVLLTELVDTPASVNDLLLTGKKRMALRTNFDVQIASQRRASFERFATTTCYGQLVVLGMRFRFHDRRFRCFRALVPVRAAYPSAALRSTQVGAARAFFNRAQRVSDVTVGCLAVVLLSRSGSKTFGVYPQILWTRLWTQ